MTTRQEKVNSLIRQEIAQYLTEEGYEGITGIVTITSVDVTADLEHAKVYFSVVNQDAAAVEKVLQDHIYEIQGMLMKKLQMRRVPRIRFVNDAGGEYAAEIGKILRTLRNQDGAGNEQ